MQECREEAGDEAGSDVVGGQGRVPTALGVDQADFKFAYQLFFKFDHQNEVLKINADGAG